MKHLKKIFTLFVELFKNEFIVLGDPLKAKNVEFLISRVEFLIS